MNILRILFASFFVQSCIILYISVQFFQQHYCVLGQLNVISRLHNDANIKKHQASNKQTLSKYKAYIKHSLHEANIQQTSSKRQTNIKQLEHMSCTVFWIHLLDIWSMFAWCLLDRVNGVLLVSLISNIYASLRYKHFCINILCRNILLINMQYWCIRITFCGHSCSIRTVWT